MIFKVDWASNIKQLTIVTVDNSSTMIYQSNKNITIMSLIYPKQQVCFWRAVVSFSDDDENFIHWKNEKVKNVIHWKNKKEWKIHMYQSVNCTESETFQWLYSKLLYMYTEIKVPSPFCASLNFHTLYTKSPIFQCWQLSFSLCWNASTELSLVSLLPKCCANKYCS